MPARISTLVAWGVCLCPLVVQGDDAPTLLTTGQLDALIASELPPGPAGNLVSDEQFLRRLSLDLIGRQPTPTELAAFVESTAPDRRDQAVERLLASPEFGTNWANYWSDTISYRVPPPELTFLNYTPFKRWLAEQLNNNVPWDQVVREILTASGKVKEKPAATFVAFHQANAVKLASETTRIFLALQLECAECHDHPFDDWKREQYHSLVGFFARAEAKLPHNDGHETVVKDKGKGEHQMPDVADPRKPGKIMQPVTLTGKTLELGKSDEERRAMLAAWVAAADNPWFARAYANRVWARLMGHGFCEPVDNIGDRQLPELPKVHEALARHFVASGFDAKQLVRLVVNSDAYRRDLNPGESSSPTFVSAVTGKLRGDQVFTSLVQAMELPNYTPPADKPTEAIRFPPPPRSTRDIVAETFGFDPSLRPQDISRTMPQAMLMMNNTQLQAQIDARPESGTMLSRLLQAETDDSRLIEKLYLLALARRPTPAELEIATAHIAELQSRNAAFEDLLWSLINSAEFAVRR